MPATSEFHHLKEILSLSDFNRTQIREAYFYDARSKDPSAFIDEPAEVFLG